MGFWSRVGAAIPVVLADGAALGGAGLCGYGAWLIFRPAGFIVGGLLLLAGAWLFARGDA
jgi:hypothetical protein